MKCVISNRLVRLFGRAIHCLSRIGDELFLEALKDGLALRTVNSSRSAYACFMFKSEFFVEYQQGCDEIDSSNPADMLKCKISMKSVLAIFKSLGTIEKTVEHCKIEFKPNECRLIFTLYCKHGIIKTHNLTYQECESLQAVFAKDFCPNQIQTQAKVLLDTVCNFPNSCEEISLRVSPDCVKVKNFVQEDVDPMKVVHTEMTLVPEEFENFQIGIDTLVTFCLKELRAVLTFSEFANQPVTLYFEHPGKPIVFALDNDVLYSGDFVMATLAETDFTSQEENTTIEDATINRTNRRINQTSKSFNRTTLNQTDTNDQRVPKRRKQDKEDIVISKPSAATNNHSSKSTQPVNNNRPKPTETLSTNKSKLSMTTNNSKNTTKRAMKETSQRVPQSGNTPMVPSMADDDFFSPTFPMANIIADEATESQADKNTHNTQHKLNSSILQNNQNKTLNEKLVESILEEDDDILMGTPPPSPPKKSKRGSFFGTCSSNGVGTDVKRAEKTVLLAADTDDEDESD
ncbi:cell cycle checkpoint control protein RAD9A-like [Clytia hemisphaerica]|uniref:Cell cycle checkpoint control protein RAD9A n=1 Tax=Clytia hemisphaerica TaxID=252671 RepID=A0A7M6DLH9_9CNID